MSQPIDGGVDNDYKIRKLAGNRKAESTVALREILVGSHWSGQRLDSCVDSSGKTPLIHAAWRGHIDSVRLLCDLGANVNAWATGEFSYGKTPLFFAITQCRDDVVLELLSRGASPRIVNNKGQSPLSLAASHLQPATIEKIIEAEARAAFPSAGLVDDGGALGRNGAAPSVIAASLVAYPRPGNIAGGALEGVATSASLASFGTVEGGGGGGGGGGNRTDEGAVAQSWLNFRASHSDQRIYGDLDPRFLDRPLRVFGALRDQNTGTLDFESAGSGAGEGADSLPWDVVTPLSVNPTTHATRRGNFERNNPGVLRAFARKQASAEARPKKSKQKGETTSPEADAPALSMAAVEEHFSKLHEAFASGDVEGSAKPAFETLVADVLDRQLPPPSATAATGSVSSLSWVENAADRIRRWMAVEPETENRLPSPPTLSTTTEASEETNSASVVAECVSRLLDLEEAEETRARMATCEGSGGGSSISMGSGDDSSTRDGGGLAYDRDSLSSNSLSPKEQRRVAKASARQRRLRRKVLYMATGQQPKCWASTDAKPTHRSGGDARAETTTEAELRERARRISTARAALPPLELGSAPVWVDSVAGLRAVKRELQECIRRQRKENAAESFHPVLGFDTEWWQPPGLSLEEASLIVDQEPPPDGYEGPWPPLLVDNIGSSSSTSSSRDSSSSLSSSVFGPISADDNRKGLLLRKKRLKKLMKPKPPLVATIAVSIADSMAATESEENFGVALRGEHGDDRSAMGPKNGGASLVSPSSESSSSSSSSSSREGAIGKALQISPSIRTWVIDACPTFASWIPDSDGEEGSEGSPRVTAAESPESDDDDDDDRVAVEPGAKRKRDASTAKGHRVSGSRTEQQIVAGEDRVVLDATAAAPAASVESRERSYRLARGMPDYAGFGRNDGDAKFGGDGNDNDDDDDDDDDDDANTAKQEEREDALRYRSELAELLSWIWIDSGARPTGFALKGDLKVLRAIKPTILAEQPRKGRSTGGGGVGKKEPRRGLRTEDTLDIQQLALLASSQHPKYYSHAQAMQSSGRSTKVPDRAIAMMQDPPTTHAEAQELLEIAMLASPKVFNRALSLMKDPPNTNATVRAFIERCVLVSPKVFDKAVLLAFPGFIRDIPTHVPKTPPSTQAAVLRLLEVSRHVQPKVLLDRLETAEASLPSGLDAVEELLKECNARNGDGAAVTGAAASDTDAAADDDDDEDDDEEEEEEETTRRRKSGGTYTRSGAEERGADPLPPPKGGEQPTIHFAPIRANSGELCTRKQPPGLSTCCAHFLEGKLSKQEQRSDWAQRPLQSEQLAYAGMDAAVLLVLAAKLHAFVPHAVAATEKIRKAERAWQRIEQGDRERGTADVPEHVMALVRQRADAREAKDYVTADSLYVKIVAHGYGIRDSGGSSPFVFRFQHNDSSGSGEDEDEDEAEE